MPGPREHAGDMPSGGDDHRIAFPPEPLEPVRVNPVAGHETHAHVLNALQFLFQNLVRKTGAGDDLLQLAAHAVVGLSLIHIYTVNLTVRARIFSLRGCHLLAMFARTPVAKAFRRWVLDVIEQYGDRVPVDAQTPTTGTLSRISSLSLIHI